MGIITIDQFRASGVDCEDIGAKIPGQDLDGCSGRVYLDTLYIEHWKDGRHGKAPPAGPTWLLTIGNMQHDGALADMELELYRYALAEGHVVTGDRPRGVKREFPDFSAYDIPLPLLDGGWTDQSWHNDAMPFFVHEPSGIGVWVNYSEKAERESPDRFIVETMEWDGRTASWMHEARGDQPVLFTTEKEEILLSSLPNFVRPRAIAHAFALAVEDECGALAGAASDVGCGDVDPLTAIRQRNATAEYEKSCATHDFLDANVHMAAAFAGVVKRPFDADAEGDVAVWNMAWEIARAERLTAPEQIASS